MPRKPTKPKQKRYTDEQLVAFIAAALAMKASNQDTADQLAGPMSIDAAIILLALIVAGSRPLPPPPASQVRYPVSAVSETDKLEGYFRANYVLAASRRLRDKTSRGVPQRIAMEQEKTYFKQHMDAARNRRLHAKEVDAAASRYGPTLGWYAKMDAKTSAECRAANGRNFDALTRPPIGYPGTVHPECRCRAGKPFGTNQTVYSLKIKVA